MPHTPEPWEVSRDMDNYGRYTILGAAHEQNEWVDEGYEISDEEGDRRAEEAQERDEGNRVLIQAAPDMLSALQDALYALEMQYANTGAVDDCRRLENARAAIRKGGEKPCR